MRFSVSGPTATSRQPLGDMLAAWRWTGNLSPVLQCAHGPICAETAVELARASGLELDSVGFLWLPSSEAWLTEPWYLVTVRLSRQLGVVSGCERMLLVPDSAQLELVARTLVELGRELVLDDVTRTESTFSTATTPAVGWLSTEHGPVSRTVVRPAGLDPSLRWSGPR